MEYLPKHVFDKVHQQSVPFLPSLSVKKHLYNYLYNWIFFICNTKGRNDYWRSTKLTSAVSESITKQDFKGVAKGNNISTT